MSRELFLTKTVTQHSDLESKLSAASSQLSTHEAAKPKYESDIVALKAERDGLRTQLDEVGASDKVLLEKVFTSFGNHVNKAQFDSFASLGPRKPNFSLKKATEASSKLQSTNCAKNSSM